MNAPAANLASARSIDLIAAEMERQTGQRLAQDRLWRIETALKQILRRHGILSLDALARRLAAGDDVALRDEVIDALLNQETSFFRDGSVLKQAVDALLDRNSGAGTRRLRIWSIGCATGQEPLSVAMILAERMGLNALNFPEIHATDVSPAAIARARSGVYSHFEVQRGLSAHRLIQWFHGDEGIWTARRELVGRVNYRRANLLIDPPPAGRFDLILCRNMLFYFSAEIRARAFDAIVAALRPGGLLAMGAGEAVIGQTARLKPTQSPRGFYERSD